MKMWKFLFLCILVCGCESFSPTVYPSAPVTPVYELAINKACQTRAISGCSDLTNGIVQYLHGQTDLAEDKLVNAIKENEAKPMASYADAMSVMATEYSLPSLDNLVIEMRRLLARKVSSAIVINPIKLPPTPKPVSETMEEVFVCEDDTCDKYHSVQHVIICSESGCAKWHHLDLGHEADSRH
jgi:hypothetical protein